MARAFLECRRVAQSLGHLSGNTTVCEGGLLEAPAAVHPGAYPPPAHTREHRGIIWSCTSQIHIHVFFMLEVEHPESGVVTNLRLHPAC